MQYVGSRTEEGKKRTLPERAGTVGQDGAGGGSRAVWRSAILMQYAQPHVQVSTVSYGPGMWNEPGPSVQPSKDT